MRKERDERESRNKGRRNLPSSCASRKMLRLPRLANKAPVMQARITINCNNKTAKKTLILYSCLYCFVSTVHWSLLKQQHLDTVIIIKVSRITRVAVMEKELS